MHFSLSSRIKKLGKLALSYPDFFSLFRTINRTDRAKRTRRAILIGSPVHCNIGDHLIAVECLKYVSRLGFDQVIEVPEFVYELFPSFLKIRSDDLVFINGGGWMGEDYEDELVIEDIIRRFPENHIIILPQTIHVSEDNAACIRRMSRALNRSDRIIVTLRESNSYRIAKELLNVPEQRLFLLPDMGLLRKPGRKEGAGLNAAIFSVRDDVEKTDDDGIDRMRDYFNQRAVRVSDSSTVIHTKYISFKGRERVIEEKIDEFSRADVVVTDRLHTMILALIAGSKCIAFDNATHKVSGVARQWLGDCPQLCLCTEPGIDPDAVRSFLEKANVPYAPDFIAEFEPLTSYVRSIIHGNPE